MVYAGSYAGIVNPKDLKINGPNGDAVIRVTQDADDMASHIERAKGAISTARAINRPTVAMGVTGWSAMRP
jgi:hypothetical protein